MDVVGFLFVSLCSNTVQVRDSVGSRHACACSEAGFSSQKVTVLEGDTTKEHCSVVRCVADKRTQCR